MAENDPLTPAKKETQLRRILVTLALCLGLISTTIPAEAYNPAARAAQIPRSGASVWAARKIDFNSGYDTLSGQNFFVFGFDWYQSEHRLELNGSEQTFEIQAEVDCAWAAYSGGNTGYIPGWWDTNIAGSALPYEGTMYPGLGGSQCTNGKTTVEVGVMNAAALTYGQHYYIRVGTAPTPSGPRPQSSVKLKVQTGATYDTDLPVLPDNEDCSFNSSEIAAWNGASQAAQDVRIQASWCSFIDWSHTVVRSGAVTGVNYWPGFNVNYLYNQGMEQAGIPGYGFGAGNNYAQYCNGGYDGSCYVQFNQGSAGYSTVWQDVTMSVEAAYYTSEVALRCWNGGTCTFDFGNWGLWNANEWRAIVSATIPQDGHWHVCRLDKDRTGAGFTVAHSVIRWQLYNYSGGNMDVDYTFLGGKTERLNPAYLGDNADPGPPCTQR